MVTIDPRNLQNLVQQKIFEDPSGGMIQARIIRQFSEFLQRSDLSEEQRLAILELLVVIGLKFAAVWTHDQRYDSMEKKRIEEANASPVDHRRNEPTRVVTAQELYLELDGFLVQCKSVLDHMVNILHYTLNLSFSALTTFGGKGNKIITLLSRNVGNDRPGKKDVAKLLITHIEGNQQWLGAMIETRDRMNHFLHGGLSPRHFSVSLVIDKEGVEKLYRPAMSPGETVKDVMSTLFYSMMDFVEYFLGVALLVRMVDHGIQFNRADDPKVPHWDVVHGASIEQLIATGKIQPK